MSVPRRSGRRPGDPDTRSTILDAARELFARNGVDKTSVRAIAADAGVDPALVHHYFGTKNALFLAAVQIPIDPATILEPLASTPVEELGPALVRGILGVWDGESQPALIALIKANLSAPDAGLLRTFVAEIVLGHLRPRVDEPAGSAASRTVLAASQIVGLLIMRYVVRLEPLASASRDDLAATVGVTLQRYLTGDLPTLPQP
ncbi:TetR/AcrR family transcriptional regulator [Gordonia soli]|uniref:Putative TetR family transcriptional regulator n=1 Tax=Gordonia soli NBRC 108243 TaxID=1223545 RepID=M0QJ86_9ACTN|nr:TetR family transcriptional regulator [Gordonia soli]GAC68690.1 putative TetR family transcriptional regulator [Gordonia soli NBRC 108243]